MGEKSTGRASSGCWGLIAIALVVFVGIAAYSWWTTRDPYADRPELMIGGIVETPPIRDTCRSHDLAIKLDGNDDPYVWIPLAKEQAERVSDDVCRYAFVGDVPEADRYTFSITGGTMRNWPPISRDRSEIPNTDSESQLDLRVDLSFQS